MAPSTPSYHIPPLYRTWFLYIDPFLSLVGVYGCFFDPTLLLSSYIPTHLPSPSSPKGGSPIPNPDVVANPAHRFIFAQLGGFFLLSIVLSLFLLRRSLRQGDMVVWKLYQGGMCLVDLAMLAATYAAYADQGRLDPFRTWRWEDWGSVLITATCTVLRTGFVLGVGVVERGGKKMR